MAKAAANDSPPTVNIPDPIPDVAKAKDDLEKKSEMLTNTSAEAEARKAYDDAVAEANDAFEQQKTAYVTAASNADRALAKAQKKAQHTKDDLERQVGVDQATHDQAVAEATVALAQAEADKEKALEKAQKDLDKALPCPPASK